MLVPPFKVIKLGGSRQDASGTTMSVSAERFLSVVMMPEVQRILRESTW
jgi:hypothetical protein